MNGQILITGGTGTLGHAIMTVAQRDGWNCRFTIYARSELRLAQTKHKFPRIRTIIGDVRDYDRLAAAVVGHDTVIHAAALKRIPECEANPRECYLTNIVGSENVARACLGNVGTVIGISTDKACQAVTTYGASKLILESIFLSYDKISKYTNYSLVRYGNVVASNGSIIPLWEKQYALGNRLTITDIGMTRFWMSPYDAVKSIDHAYCNAGYIYVPKVSSCSMVSLANHLFPSCDFQEVGLRSNEKLHEDLVSVDELSSDCECGFLVGIGSRGSSYRSSIAEHLRMENFDRMLADARELE